MTERGRGYIYLRIFSGKKQSAISFLSINEPIKSNIYGQKVAALINGFVQSGNHFIRFDASNLASGVYFYRLKTLSFSKTGKMLMVR